MSEEKELSPLEKALAEFRAHPSDATVSYGNISKLIELLAAK